MAHPWKNGSLAELARFYEAEAADATRFTDDDVIRTVESSFWGTSCWSYAEATFAMIAPACARRPHLARRLLRHPIAAMIAGGLEDAAEVLPNAIACATNPRVYVEPTEEGKAWLLHVLPRNEAMLREVFAEVDAELEREAKERSTIPG